MALGATQVLSTDPPQGILATSPVPQGVQSWQTVLPPAAAVWEQAVVIYCDEVHVRHAVQPVFARAVHAADM